VPPDPELIDKAKRAGVTRAFVGLENINPDNLMAANKRQNKITNTGICSSNSTSAASSRWRATSRLSRRHQGLDPARYRDHQARIAGRYPRILLPHSAARLGGPPEALQCRRVDGPGPQQIRPHHRVSHHGTMSDQEWEETYKAAWDSYFTWSTWRRSPAAMRAPGRTAQEGDAVPDRIQAALRQ